MELSFKSTPPYLSSMLRRIRRATLLRKHNCKRELFKNVLFSKTVYTNNVLNALGCNMARVSLQAASELPKPIHYICSLNNLTLKFKNEMSVN